MRFVCIALVLTFAGSDHVTAQTPSLPKEFAVTAFIIPSDVPTRDVGPNDPLDSMPSVLWVGIKNDTWLPYALCTAGTGFADRNSVGGTGGSCFRDWIVLPGETHFERIAQMSLHDPGAAITASALLRGKPLASNGPLVTWQLRWEGTVAEALALGDWIRAGP